MNETPTRQQTYFYDTIRASDHEELARFVNHAATQGWEPIQCWSDRASFNIAVGVNGTDHFCLMRRPVDY